jgi:hypothetical protein
MITNIAEAPPEKIDAFPGIPEQILAVTQWVDMHRGTGLSNEQRLYFAVLEDAIRAITRTEGHRWQERKADALAWVAGDYARLPFWQVCEALEIDPDWLREALQRAQSVDLARRSPVTYRSFVTTIPKNRISGSRRDRKMVASGPA